LRGFVLEEALLPAISAEGKGKRQHHAKAFYGFAAIPHRWGQYENCTGSIGIIDSLSLGRHWSGPE
jgi:hypothetical protein